MTIDELNRAIMSALESLEEGEKIVSLVSEFVAERQAELDKAIADRDEARNRYIERFLTGEDPETPEEEEEEEAEEETTENLDDILREAEEE